MFFILLCHACDMDTTIYLNRRTGKDWCKILLGVYVFIGEDCVSVFKGKGKVIPLKKYEISHILQCFQ